MTLGNIVKLKKVKAFGFVAGCLISIVGLILSLQRSVTIYTNAAWGKCICIHYADRCLKCFINVLRGDLLSSGI